MIDELPDCDDGDPRGYYEPLTETIIHRHRSLPFIEIQQERYVEAEPGDERFEDWSFWIWGPGGSVAYDSAAYERGEYTEQQMITALSERAERHLLNDDGPFFVLRIYLETGQYRREIDAVMMKHGQSPLLRRAEAAISRRLGLERWAIRMRCRMRLKANEADGA
jgi:hypothetical protein